jgi:hypothetical protein
MAKAEAEATARARALAASDELRRFLGSIKRAFIQTFPLSLQKLVARQHRRGGALLLGTLSAQIRDGPRTCALGLDPVYPTQTTTKNVQDRGPVRVGKHLAILSPFDKPG